MSRSQERLSLWYFGGLASAGAACVTHPLDLLKVQMQTQKGKNISMFQLTKIVIKNQGKIVSTYIFSISLFTYLFYLCIDRLAFGLSLDPRGPKLYNLHYIALLELYWACFL